MNKKVLIGIIVVAVAALVWWMIAARKAAAPTGTTAQKTEDSSYTSDLNGLNEADIQSEFQATDAEASKL